DPQRASSFHKQLLDDQSEREEIAAAQASTAARQSLTAEYESKFAEKAGNELVESDSLIENRRQAQKLWRDLSAALDMLMPSSHSVGGGGSELSLRVIDKQNEEEKKRDVSAGKDTPRSVGRGHLSKEEMTSEDRAKRRRRNKEKGKRESKDRHTEKLLKSKNRAKKLRSKVIGEGGESIKNHTSSKQFFKFMEEHK
ncbi:hypothetical protein ADUPG1_013884, partial [Aduncisulcus paluster]